MKPGPARRIFLPLRVPFPTPPKTEPRAKWDPKSQSFAKKSVRSSFLICCYWEGLMDDDKDWLTNAINDPSRQTKMLEHEAVQLYPLAGYSTATISATGALLKIEFLVPPPHEGTRVLPLGLTRAQCTELADALRRLATLPHKASEAKN
jgi:hypothetical protein